MKNGKQELKLYIAMWLAIFMVPVAWQCHETFFTSGTRQPFSFADVTGAWSDILPYLLLFAIHHFLLLPYFARKKTKTYVALAAAAILMFYGLQSIRKPNSEMDRPEREELFRPGPYQPQANGQPGRPSMPETHWKEHPDRPPVPPEKPEHRTRLPFDGPDFLRMCLALLMLNLDLLGNQYFRLRREKEARRELEKQTLQQELEYLKYQINPHFFMNTLNNIHALVDIDPEAAKRTIVQLSGLMRYVLYDGAQKTISLQKETDFINHYISLMKIRYNKKVEITVDAPETIPDIQVPPLLFIPFIENAFKHGISYRTTSFVHISLQATGNRLCFQCSNSRHHTEAKPDHYSGIGLENVRKRLALLYAERYTLDIDESDPDVYCLKLNIPIYDQMLSH